jgi:hypothetical protein
MKTKSFVGMMALVVAIVMTVLWVSPLGAAGSGAPRIAPPNSHAFGETLTDWLSIYWRWYWDTNQDPAQSKVGHVQLMPLPAGDCIQGSDDVWTCTGQLEITLPPGTPFVLPLAALTGERYGCIDDDGVCSPCEHPYLPDDQPYTEDQLGIHPSLTIDGRTIITDANQAKFYVPATYFNPPIVYATPSWYCSVAAIFFQGVGFVSPPLPPGVHVIHLYEPFTLFNVIYENTWIVTVSPK